MTCNSKLGGEEETEEICQVPSPFRRHMQGNPIMERAGLNKSNEQVIQPC